MFAITSRYYALPPAQFVAADGTIHAYVTRRIVPQPERFALLQEHTVQNGERLDTVTAHYLDDPEQFWRLADANNTLKPEELTDVPGRRLRITLPEGIPGNRHA
jgi:hypothetical protein